MQEYLKMWRNYFVFSGRSTRRDFWMAFLMNIVVSTVVGFVAGLFEMAWIVTLYSLLMLIPMWTLEVRRLHDINKSGWCLLLSLIPVIGTIILIVFLASPSVDEGNVYGDIVE